ncbi:fatty-acid-binding protein 2 [Prosopis cineraria]|uniref:fatty-acid-binding protein 2-like n=1 Tax=Prosopis cineraria TaxID=364024 RepID=UPI00240F8A9F|nr:fatty-acid-binding protein 2-like [Prosopis cineraria]XP_054791896.1 fatty-acid-binding protein 2-like [Prosopis cineraria]XP_054796100.1 fatty-acid-binding protein 2-like [Prosopis cineraria]XP_054796101.1 fatty-acid-binding protein 2-like [Prosopis cineraria]XP_054796621.1 fatty-acid-binding protein 2 [Prosopis cineraria]XP_054796622.1 fatty-acid-binding protein 2 [Prosopis cineraria]
MKSDWLSSMGSDGVHPDIFSLEPFVFHNLGSHLFSQLHSFADNSIYQSRNLYVPGSLALQEAFNRISGIAGAFLVWFCSGTNSKISRDIAGSQFRSSGASMQVKPMSSVGHNLVGFHFSFRSERKSIAPVALAKISSSAMRLLWREVKRLQSNPVLSLAAVLVPPIQNLSSTVLTGPLENTEVSMHGGKDQIPCEVKKKGCAQLSFPELNLTKHVVEPKTGIEFPMILNNVVDEEQDVNLNSEVLVGTGSRTMTIVKIKSLKIYAFGFYVHPHSLCEKLGPKYASFSAGELNNSHGFYKDLLREDVEMTVRLVVNCKGMKINTVKEAFEKSLRARLVKTNPSTDFCCLRKFRSYFTQDIPLPLGTTINFRRTADGCLITEIGGNHIGSVPSKDLCRAFFDMYIGDEPVSEQTKEEIGKNVVNIIRRC